MSDQNSIFGTNNQVTPESTQNQNTDPVAALTNQLSQIKNENGEPKYKTLDDAIKALAHSQAYIPELNSKVKQYEQELATAKAEAARVKELEQTVQQLLVTQKTSESVTPSTVISEDKIAEIVQKTLTRSQEQSKADENLRSVVSVAQQQFGEKADEVFYKKAEELGLSKAEINTLAAKSPKAVFELLGIKPNTQSKSPFNGSSVNTSGITPPADTFIKANEKSALFGTTTAEVLDESRKAKSMVDELHSQGKTIQDLTDPKVYFKHFSR